MTYHTAQSDKFTHDAAYILRQYPDQYAIASQFKTQSLETSQLSTLGDLIDAGGYELDIKIGHFVVSDSAAMVAVRVKGTDITLGASDDSPTAWAFIALLDGEVFSLSILPHQAFERFSTDAIALLGNVMNAAELLEDRTRALLTTGRASVQYPLDGLMEFLASDLQEPARVA